MHACQILYTESCNDVITPCMIIQMHTVLYSTMVVTMVLATSTFCVGTTSFKLFLI